MNTLIFLIRHGETPWTLSGQHTGNTDLSLTTNGRLQAEKMGKFLSNYTFDQVFSSPLKRAKETCEIAGLSGKAVLDKDLIEWNYGDYEGKTSFEIHKSSPNWDLFRDGAPGGESISDVSARADRFLKKILYKNGKIAVFSSGHILRVVIARWLGLSASQGQLFALETASLTLLGFEHQKPVLIAPTIE